MRYLCLLVVTLTCSAACGDVVILKNGDRVEGEIVAETDDVVLVSLPDGGRKKITRNGIREIVWSALPETALPAAVSSRPTDAGFAILSPKIDSNHVSDDPDKPPSGAIVVSGRVWSAAAKVAVTVRKGGQRGGTASAAVRPPEKKGEPATWEARVKLFRGYNTVEASATAPGGKAGVHSVRTFLDPIHPAQAGDPYLNEDGTQQLGRNGKPIPNDIQGVVTLSFTARDPKEVARYEVMLDGKTVSNKALYLWDTSKHFEEAHVITFVVRYKDGEVYHSSPRSYRAHRVRSRLVAGGTPPWRELDRKGRELFKEGNYKKAFEVITEAVVCGQKNVGRDHPDTAISLCNLGTVCEAVKQYPEAEKCYRRALAILEKRVGKDHRHVAGVLSMLARMYEASGRPDEARACKERAGKILGR
jgi:hypothetical protein